MNDIFTFTLRYQDGTLHTPKLAVLSGYLSALGTDSLKKQQLEKAWQQIGTTMEVAHGYERFSFNLTGPDHQLKPALQLLAHFLKAAQGDDEALSEAKDADKVDRKSFGKQKGDVIRPVLRKVAYGDKSEYLTQLSKKEVKALKSNELLEVFRELQKYDCELFYCGKQPVADVAAISQEMLPLDQCTKPKADTYRRLQQYSEPTVFFYDVPKSRQNYVVSYDALGALPSAEERTKLAVFDEYFGGGMSSVLFQNVREFRSLAYSTSGQALTTSRAQHAQEPLAYITATGTQADKTMEAIATIDSLLRQMPMKKENLEAACQSVLSTIQNNYPTFRDMAKYIANQMGNGYTSDPNADFARLLPGISEQDIIQLHQKCIAGNQNRVWIIIGDKKLTDMKTLARYGKIVELKKEEVYR